MIGCVCHDLVGVHYPSDLSLLLYVRQSRYLKHTNQNIYSNPQHKYDCLALARLTCVHKIRRHSSSTLTHLLCRNS